MHRNGDGRFNSILYCIVLGRRPNGFVGLSLNDGTILFLRSDLIG